MNTLNNSILENAFSIMATAKAMTKLYEDNFKIVSKYVHATSRGHEAVQIALAMHLLPQDIEYQLIFPHQYVTLTYNFHFRDKN